MLIGIDNRADDALAISTNSETPTLPVANLVNEHVGRKWRTAAGVTSAYALLDMGASVTANLLALLGTNLTSTGTMRLRASPSSADLSADVTLDTGTIAAAVKQGYGAFYKAFDLTYLSLPGLAANYASTPHSLANTFPGDLCVIAKVELVNWTPASAMVLVSKWRGSTNDCTFIFQVNTAGRLVLTYSTDGVSNVALASTASPAVSNSDPLCVAVTLDVSNAGNHVAKFWTCSDYDRITRTGSWVQLGADVVTAGTITLYDGEAGVEIGSRNEGSFSSLEGKVYYAHIQDSTGLTKAPLVKFDLDGVAAGAASFVSSTGETWTINASGAGNVAEIVVDDPVSARYWRVDLADAAVAEGHLSVGRLFLGPAWRTSVPQLFDWAPVTIDASLLRRSYAGQTYADRRPKRRGLMFTLDYMNEAEMYGNAFRLGWEKGITGDIVAIPDIDGAYVSEQAVFGQLQVNEPLFHRLPQIYRQKFTVIERL